VDEVFFLERTQRRLQDELVLGAVIRLEEGIRIEEDGGELAAREKVIPLERRSSRSELEVDGAHDREVASMGALGDGHALWIPRTSESR
jgi:hypothetical protein